jgi:hypothetical protein
VALANMPQLWKYGRMKPLGLAENDRKGLTMTYPNGPLGLDGSAEAARARLAVIDERFVARQRLVVQRDQARRAALSADKELGEIEASINHLHDHRQVVPLGDLAHRRAKAVVAVRSAAREFAAIEAQLSKYADVPANPQDLREHVADLTRRAGLVPW